MALLLFPEPQRLFLLHLWRPVSSPCCDIEPFSPVRPSLPPSGVRRFIVLVRFGVMIVFLRWRCLNPNPDAYPLWLASVICEIWFGLSWLLDQFPKWSPIDRETYLNRLALKYGPPHLPLYHFPSDQRWYLDICESVPAQPSGSWSNGRRCT
jgi:hypothetical protein